MKGLIYLFIFQFFIFNTVNAQFDFNSFFNPNYYNYSSFKPEPIFNYETKVTNPKQCTSFETYDFWRQTCNFKCYAGQDCVNYINNINNELDQLTYIDSSYQDNFQVNEGNSFINYDNLVASYSVKPGESLKLLYGKDDSTYRTLWEIIMYIFPNYITDKYLEKFNIYSDPNDSALAYVSDDNNIGKFTLSINIPTFNSLENSQKIITLVHELGHILSLNYSQVNQNIDFESCEYYYSDSGCFNQSSFINNFVYKFWPQAELDKIVYNENNNNNLFLEDKTKYINEYAASNEIEDFAETFAYFVMENKEYEGILKDKINFFQSNELLLKYKNEILNGIKRYATTHTN